MANYAKHTSQGLLLFSLVLLAACSVISAHAGGIDVMKSEVKMGMRGMAAAIRDGRPDMNGCYHNTMSHSEEDIFCCSKDKECWPSLQDCIPNCPCKVNC